MKQQLFFESHWDKQVSPQDRHLIEKVFSEVDFSALEGLYASYIRHDINYKDELLYIVLIHNCTHSSVEFKKHKVILKDKNNNQLSEKFDIPIPLKPFASMPWTFIFKGKYKKINVAHSSIII